MATQSQKFSFSADQAMNLLYQKNFVSDTDKGFLQTLLDEQLEVNSVPNFYAEHFIVDGTEQSADLTDRTKNPAWSVRSEVKDVVPMAESMAPLTETAQLDTHGYEERQGSIFQFGKGLYTNSLNDIEMRARLAALDTQDQNIINGFVVGTAKLIQSNIYRLNNMGAQTLSYGGAYSNANTIGWGGPAVNQNAYIPTKNFIKAGKQAWNDMTVGNECNIIEQMQKIEYEFKTSLGVADTMAFEWDIQYSQIMSVFLKNPSVIAEVNRYITMYAPDKVVVIDSGKNTINTSIITWEQLVAYSSSSISKISPIRVIKESQKVQDINLIRDVNGWKNGVAVLRPLGFAGIVVHAQPNDVALAAQGVYNDSVQVNIAKVLNFLYVINKQTPDGSLKAYHTDVIGRYATVLNEIQYHLCVDTLTADA